MTGVEFKFNIEYIFIKQKPLNLKRMKRNNRKLTKIFKIGFLFLGISLFLWSCEKQDANIVEISEDEILITDNNFYELSFDKNFSTTLTKIQKEFKEQSKSSSSKQKYQIKIDSTKIRKVATSNTITYNILIERENENYFENLVLNFFKNEKPQAFIVKYYPTGKGKSNKNHNPFHFEGKYSIEKINYDDLDLHSKVTCTTSHFIYCDETGRDSETGKFYNGTHLADPVCFNLGNDNLFTVTRTSCEATAEESITPTNEEIIDYSSGGGSGLTVGSGNPYLSPLLPCNSISLESDINSGYSCSSLDDILGNNLFSELSDKHYNWLQKNIEVHNYLTNLASSNIDIVFLKEFIPKVIRILNKEIYANTLETKLENSLFLSLVSDLLHKKNDKIFYQFNTLYSNLDSDNSLTIADWQMISSKIDEIHSIYLRYNINYQTELSQLSSYDQKVIAENSLFIGFLPSVNSILGEYWPKNADEWAVIGELFAQFLPELALGFIPGSDIIEVIKGVDNGDTVAVALGLAGLIVDAFGGTILKGLTKAFKIGKKVFTTFKLSYKFIKVIGKALKAGLKVSLDGTTVIFKKSSKEIARITNNVMTFNYTGFGGKIVTNPNKTTTVIGKWQNGTKEIIDSGLSKSGKNTGGINALSETPNPNWNDQQIWDNINEPWLREAANRNDVIRVISDPNNPTNIFKNNGDLSFFGREHNLLTTPVSQGGLGYTYNSSTFTYFK